jgi:uncharacterized membrane protein
MYKSGSEAMTPAPDDIRRSSRRSKNEANVPTGERYLSLLAGSVLLLSALRRRSLILLAGSGALLYRGASGFCYVYNLLGVSPESQGLQIEETVTVNKPPEEVYRAWRRLENLPRFMSHLESVTPVDERQSHWVAKISGPLKLEWDAIIVEDEPNKKISWRSVAESRVDHSGSVLFRHLPARNLTEVKIIMSYRPPLGPAGEAVAKLIGRLTEHQIRQDLRAFKTMAEAGEKPTIEGQPVGPSPKRMESIRAEEKQTRDRMTSEPPRAQPTL